MTEPNAAAKARLSTHAQARNKALDRSTPDTLESDIHRNRDSIIVRITDCFTAYKPTGAKGARGQADETASQAKYAGHGIPRKGCRPATPHARTPPLQCGPLDPLGPKLVSRRLRLSAGGWLYLDRTCTRSYASPLPRHSKAPETKHSFEDKRVPKYLGTRGGTPRCTPPTPPCGPAMPRCNAATTRCNAAMLRCKHAMPQWRLTSPQCNAAMPQCKHAMPRCRLTSPRCNAAMPQCKHAMSRCNVTMPRCRLTSSRCNVTMRRCKSTMPRCKGAPRHFHRGILLCKPL